MAGSLNTSRRLWRIIKWISDQFALIGGGLTIVMMLAGLREVVGRYFFAAPSNWAIELNCYLLVALVYLSGAHTETVEGHIKIDYLYCLLSGKRKIIVDILIHAVGISWAGMLFWQGGRLALHSLLSHARSAEAMMWPLFPSQVMVPIGALLLGIVLACKLLICVFLLIDKETVWSGG